MRVTRIMIPLVVALAAAGCARQQQTAYVIDPATGQPVPVVQQYSAPQYGYAQASYQAGYQAGYPAASPQAAPQPAYAHTPRRGLYGERQSYAAGSYAQAYEAPQPQYAQASSRGLFGAQDGYQARGGRGLFNARPTYAQPQHAQPAPYQSSVLQYHPPAASAAQPASSGYGYAYAPTNYEQRYTLGAGDKLRVVVFGQQGISGSYMVDAGGNITLPLAGTVPARGFTTHQVAREIIDRLKQGYVRQPHVTVSIEAYRPFFILGEVTTPGQYPYIPNMTAEKAVAVAGGFSPRAYKKTVELTRNAGGQRFTGDVPLNYPIRPGDTVVVKERWF